MCLAIPGQIISIDDTSETIGRMGRVNCGGVTRQVSLSMTPQAQKGDYVLIHAGNAIEMIDEEEARMTLKAIQSMMDDECPLEMRRFR